MGRQGRGASQPGARPRPFLASSLPPTEWLGPTQGFSATSATKATPLLGQHGPQERRQRAGTQPVIEWSLQQALYLTINPGL